MPQNPPGSSTPPFVRTGEGTPLVLLHGLTGTWRVWTPVLPAVSAKHDVLAPTLLGHGGGTPHPADAEISVAALADDVERAMDAAGFGTAHVVGNSLGGWVTLELARRGRATSAVAFSPAGGWLDDRRLARVSRLMRQASRFGSVTNPGVLRVLRRPRARKLAFRSVMAHGERVPAAAALEMTEDLGACTILEPFLAATLRDGPFAEDMSQVTCPVRVAWAELDRTIPFPGYGVPLMEHLPNAELVHLPGVGHVPMFDDPALVARTILEVTGRVDAEQGTEVGA
ncbi:alpha/beta fold hydrolase [Patulibacter minatonensis]|uniref:alpha/beta fold hydrolase n=1 Tax=Patulibacter minatonensis TaxID=298163 RepID=UPI0004B11F7B|nr:alpha/beta fold hydrolase [Patulibacter minatonensis]